MHVQLTISETIHQVFVTIHGPQLTPAIKELQRNIEAVCAPRGQQNTYHPSMRFSWLRS